MLPREKQPVAAARRREEDNFRRRRQLHAERQHHQDDYDEEELQWRQAAQMLTDQDEILLASRAQNRTSGGQNQNRFAGNWATGRATPDSGASNERQQDYLEDADEDENSSISFAQSGCHSILSAWRFKAANKARQRELAKQARPTSVLSNASSARKSVASTAFTLRSSGRAPASQTRIPLGPRQAQHFVTNTRRRRRANELILNTLEARRRALALNRQNASLLGSATYLNGPEVCFPEHVLLGAGGDLYAAGEPPGQRLSLSPSPVAGFRSGDGRTPSPAPRRSTLSDLGGSRQLQQARRQLASSPVQRELLRKLARSPPPLAKPDQNSSDLYTSNSSSSGSSESGSQFTQLVTSELAPDCVLLENQALRERFRTGQPRPKVAHPVSSRAIPVSEPATSKPVAPTPPPRPQERRKRPQELKRPSQKEARSEEPPEDAASGSGKLRRGALRRDSIRRLRLNRQPAAVVAPRAKGHSFSSSSSSSSEAAPYSSETSAGSPPEPPARQQALPLARKLNIENNPFLNRGHFRSSTSVRGESIPRSELSLPRQEETNGQERNSWLMGARRASSREPERRLAGGEPRRSNSNEALHARRNNANNFNEANKVGKQQAELRQEARQPPERAPKPGQVFSSSSTNRESSSRLESRRTLVEAAQPARGQLFRETTARAGPTQTRSDLKFDDELERKWLGPGYRATSESQVERRELVRSEKMEVFRSSSISPPMGFSDASKARSSMQDNSRRVEDRKLQPVGGSPATSGRSRAASAERPPVAARKRQAPQVAPRPASLQPQQAPRRPASELPTFERTADDEFRKRVDYLRKLARANLESSPASVARPPSARASPVTRPPSTNWRHSADSTTVKVKPLASAAAKPTVPARSSLQPASSSLFDERANWRLGPLADRPPGESRPGPATTNLDSILADRYQSRGQLAAGPVRWQRSNSSLASLGSGGGCKPAASLRSNQNTNQSRQQPEQRLTPATFDAADGQGRESEVVKLVVKERSAPRLNYAFVEQQPAVQHALGRAQSQQPARQQPAGSSGTINKLPVRQPPGLTASQRSSSPVRFAAPRSPEFGATAASSNDDSAIASSVSSPSLSFMLNPNRPANLEKQAVAANRPQLLGLRPTARPAEGGASGALQSILRRANQQQLSGESSDSSAAQLPLAGQQEVHQLQQQQQRALSPQPQQQQQQLPAGQDSSPPKRVHFNDRTSVRSFESVSSLNSNSTAVPNELGLLRQQLGSPDSTGSGSGRLSAESPDHRKGGAAIYAVRGDLELEPAEPVSSSTASFINAVGLHTTAQLTRNPYGQLAHQQPARFAPDRMLAPPAGSQPYIKMTAPPTISTGAPQLHQQQQHAYIVRPAAQMAGYPRPFAPEMDEDEDPSYSARLRQAATSRAFLQFAPPPPGPLLSPQQYPVVAPNLQQQQHQQARLLPVQQMQQPGGAQAPIKRPLNVEEYLNFQTEV